mgnify:FL=1
MYINPYILGPAAGAFFGYLMGCLMNSRAIIGTANWIPAYVVLGALAGLSGAAKLGNAKDREKGEFLTETKSYKKKHAKKKDKVNKD